MNIPVSTELYKKLEKKRGTQKIGDYVTQVLSSGIEPDSEQVVKIRYDLIRNHPHQPRKYIDPKYVDEIAASIKQVGLIQPPILCATDDGHYVVVAGQVRWLAWGKLAMSHEGYDEMPAIVRQMTLAEMYAVAAVENAERQDLGLLDKAKSILDGVALGYSQEEAGRLHGEKSPGNISDIVNILKLPEQVLDLLQKPATEFSLTLAHAKELRRLQRKIRPDQVQTVIDIAMECFRNQWRAKEDLKPQVDEAITRLSPPPPELPLMPSSPPSSGEASSPATTSSSSGGGGSTMSARSSSTKEELFQERYCPAPSCGSQKCIKTA